MPMRHLQILSCTVLAGLCLFSLIGCSEEHAPRTLTPPEVWALATSAIPIERQHERHNLLGGLERTQTNIESKQIHLRQQWGIHNREDLLGMFHSIERGGDRIEFEKLALTLSSLKPEQHKQFVVKAHRDAELRHRVKLVERYHKALGDKSLRGWDYGRYVVLARWGYLAGYLSEKEAWGRIQTAVRILRPTFSSWRDLGENFLIGREFRSFDTTMETDQLYRDAYASLLADSESPWNRYHWNLQ